MIKFILHVAEMLALLVSAYLSQMVAILAVGLVFPPAIPLVSIAYLISIAAFWDEMVEVMSKGAIEIAKCETGQTTFPSALWSALISGFVSGLWYPSPKLADTLIPPTFTGLRFWDKTQAPEVNCFPGRGYVLNN